ncbi:MAG TPA: hypothetical protein VNF46_06305 [Gammaproteobacteria bacterium]|nr:hypothetical protein [Gammaproteobacteria bacterium]
MNKSERDPLEQRRRRAVRTAIIAALVAIGFYVGFFVFMRWTHHP